MRPAARRRPASSSTNATCPLTSLRAAVAGSSHAARSISGNSRWRPEPRGHSSVKVLLLI